MKIQANLHLHSMRILLLQKGLEIDNYRIVQGGT